jgi:hypothetical protein
LLSRRLDFFYDDTEFFHDDRGVFPHGSNFFLDDHGPLDDDFAIRYRVRWPVVVRAIERNLKPAKGLLICDACATSLMWPLRGFAGALEGSRASYECHTEGREWLGN